MYLVVLCALVAYANAANRLCHGDIDQLHPTGKHTGGVAGSNAEVQHDLPALNNHRSCYQQSADTNCIQASVIAALASRESRGGSLLVSTGGWGDNHHAWGILQCDVANSGLPCTSVPWDSCAHIEMMVHRLLVPYINQVKAKHPDWSQHQALQGGVAAYNFGVSNVQSWGGLDIGSTGNDYSNDVIARAKWLKANGWN
ncbi:glycine, glutamate and proline-rich protein-like [Physella acuta]|uniref:G-type lysozyme n=1 Tax=Physella acuta TaxID=109671 RepID=G8CYM6_PHYAT|nr:glycine, glutamate and proline-rich protein-like [Physella acuta]ADV36303.1 G-type lysozyme [Physella acuta]